MSNLKDVAEAARIVMSIAKEVVEDRGWTSSWTFGYRQSHPYFGGPVLDESNYNKAVFVQYEEGKFFTKENPLNNNEEKKEIKNSEEIVQALNKLEGEGNLFGFDVMIIRK